VVCFLFLPSWGQFCCPTPKYHSGRACYNGESTDLSWNAQVSSETDGGEHWFPICGGRCCWCPRIDTWNQYRQAERSAVIHIEEGNSGGKRRSVEVGGSYRTRSRHCGFSLRGTHVEAFCRLRGARPIQTKMVACLVVGALITDLHSCRRTPLEIISAMDEAVAPWTSGLI